MNEPAPGAGPSGSFAVAHKRGVKRRAGALAVSSETSVMGCSHGYTGLRGSR
jgi:hypothetical protein